MVGPLRHPVGRVHDDDGQPSRPAPAGGRSRAVPRDARLRRAPPGPRRNDAPGDRLARRVARRVARALRRRSSAPAPRRRTSAVSDSRSNPTSGRSCTRRTTSCGSASGPGVELTLDYGHYTAANFTDEQIEPLVPKARHIHMRPAAPGRLQVQVRLQDNTIDFERTIDVLDERGYDGFILVEYLWPISMPGWTSSTSSRRPSCSATGSAQSSTDGSGAIRTSASSTRRRRHRRPEPLHPVAQPSPASVQAESEEDRDAVKIAAPPGLPRGRRARRRRGEQRAPITVLE